MWRSKPMITLAKQPPVIEDLRNHSQEQMAELRFLLSSGAPARPDPRRPGFFEIEGPASVSYVFKYPSGSKKRLGRVGRFLLLGLASSLFNPYSVSEQQN